ncbi:MAG: DUF3108 domain-containing protein [Bacteroidetes bacterium]|nr:DUF3108 domain-containing protein [Bacteroidota bacterium]MCA6443903.1 DUF3108 domain-containing protein [Bacteroidota bacterium]
MKSLKQFALKSATGVIAIALCSAGLMPYSTQQLESVIEKQLPPDFLPQKQNNAFKEGEVLSYRMHYGPVNAGVAILEVKPDLIEVSGRKVYHIVGTGFTTGTTDWFFKVRDKYETYMDKDALLPWMFVRNVNEGGYKFSQNYTFNHYTKKVDVGGGEKFDVPAGVQDMVSAFYSARNLDLNTAKDGDIFTLNCFLDKEIWPLKIKFIGRETIETDLGKVKALKFRPIVQKGRVFKKEEDLNVWISDDDNHIVLKAQADVLIGSIKMELTKAINLANPIAKVN